MVDISVIHYICSGEKNGRRERKRSLHFYSNMTNDEQIQQIEQLIQQILEDTPEYFCVSTKIKPINNIKVFLEGDNGITIEACVKINRKLYHQIEVLGIYPEGEFSLEVSSPGVTEPLKLHRQYVKNLGRFVEIIFTEGTIKEGKLLEVNENDLLLEYTEGKGKKAIVQNIVIPFINIKTATVQVKF